MQLQSCVAFDAVIVAAFPASDVVVVIESKVKI